MIYKTGDIVTASKSDKRRGITEGKQYEVLKCTIHGITVVNDSGKKYHVYFSHIVPHVEEGKGKFSVKVTFATSPACVAAVLKKTFRPVTGNYLVVNGVPLKIRSVITNVNGDSVVTVSKADSGTIARVGLL